MKKLLTLPVLLLVLTASLTQIGCGGSDDPVTPPPEECSITVTTPIADDTFQSGEQIRIRWDETGTAEQVTIDLLKGGSLVDNIDTTANDGYKSWDASTLGAASGNDFSIRVLAVGETGCGDTSGNFTILNTEDCNFNFTIDFDPDNDPETVLILNAGEEFEITWTSENTTGFVNIELLRGDLPDDAPVGFIASNVLDSGSYLWTVDSLHEGTYDYFYLRISDRNVAGCSAITQMFPIIDEDVCEIWVSQPQPGVTWDEGTTQTISFTAMDPNTTHVNINLYQGNVWVNNIETNLSIPSPGVEQDIQWVVDTIGSTSSTSFRIKVSDALDQYCVGWSANFTIPQEP